MAEAYSSKLRSLNELLIVSVLLTSILSACSDSDDPTASPSNQVNSAGLGDSPTSPEMPGEADKPGEVVKPGDIEQPNEVGDYPRVSFNSCAFDTEMTLNEIRCGVLETYENYESTGADARIIQVAFGIVPASTTPVAPDPVVVFTGGPGVSALAEFALFNRVEKTNFGTNNRDLILVDQRGVGFSEPFLQCDGLLISDDFSPDLDSEDAKNCIDEFEQQGVDLSQYRSSVIAQDFKALREALKIEQWNVYGASYGPIPGILYAALDPDGVRSVIFDSSTDNQVDIALADAAAPLDYITELAAQCAQEAECASRLPDLRSTFIDTFRMLMEDPWVVSVSDSIEPDQELDAIFMFDSMVDSEGFAAPAILEAFANRDLEFLLQLSSGDDDDGLVIPNELRGRLEADLMHATVQCAAIDAQSFDSAIVPTIDQWPDDFINLVRSRVVYPQVCLSDVLPVEQDLTQRMPLKLDVPTLIVGGALDGAVSVKQLRKFTESFESPTVAIVPKGGHGVYLPAFDGCIEGVVTSFLENPASAPDIACINENVQPFLFGEDLISAF